MIELLQSRRVAELAKEKSVRGEVARLAREQAVDAEPEELELLAAALNELFERFSSLEGDAK